jgi:predicted dienelactone hydrolase
VEIWYPATPSASVATVYQLKLGALVLAESPSPYGAVRDAPLDRHGAPHPLVLFTHGSFGTRLQSLFVTEYLATHGFVVAAPDHVGNTFAEAIDSASALPTIDIARMRPGDVSHSLDALIAKSADAPDDPLALGIDATRVGVMGHSFGGFTVFRVAGASVDVALADDICGGGADEFFCEGWPGSEPFPSQQGDDRIIAAVAQSPGGAGAFQGMGGFEEITVPVMIQAGTADETTPYAEEARAPFEALSGGAELLTLEGAGHFTFADICVLLEDLGIDIEQFDDGCGPDNMPLSVAHPIIQRYATAFLLLHVAGMEAYRSELDTPPPEGATLESAAP